MKRVYAHYLYSTLVAMFFLIVNAATASEYDVTIFGSDAIFLAGRTDVVIPSASETWTTGTHLVRHTHPIPEDIQETLPPYIPVVGNDVIRVLDPEIGGISLLNGFGVPYYGPNGTGGSGSYLSSMDGLSGYKGQQGALTGVFLDDSIPGSGPPPVILDFSIRGIGTDFDMLSPMLNQIFFVGDGINSGGFQDFVAPLGATRLFLGIPDGFGFIGAPGAYDDNDGSYRIRIGVNETPTIPIPSSVLLFGSGFMLLIISSRRNFVWRLMGQYKGNNSLFLWSR